MMSDKKFVHLHVHSEYSLLEASSTFDSLVEKAAAHIDAEKAARIHGEFEPLDLPHIRVDMTGALDGIVEEIVAYMAEGGNAVPLKKESGT